MDYTSRWSERRRIGPIRGCDYLTTEIPDEILLIIGDHLERSTERGNNISKAPTFAALSLGCRKLHGIFDYFLYRYDIERSTGFALLWGIRHNSINTIKKALDFGENIDLGTVVYDVDCRTHRQDVLVGTSMHWAISMGNEEAVQLLLDRGASLTTLSQDMCTCKDTWLSRFEGVCLPLHLALCHEQTQIADLLIRHGAPCRMHYEPPQPLPPSIYQDTQVVTGATHTAAYFGQHCLFNRMIEKAAAGASGWTDPGNSHSSPSNNIINRHGPMGNPLPYAAISSKSSPDTISALMSVGADIDSCDWKGKTPLAVALNQGHWDIALALLDMGAEKLGTLDMPNTKEQAEKTIMQVFYANFEQPTFIDQVRFDKMAWLDQRERVIRQVIQKYRHLNLDTQWLQNSFVGLFDACRWDDDSMDSLIPLFLDLGADINGKSDRHETPLLRLAQRYAWELPKHFWGPNRGFGQGSLNKMAESMTTLLQHGATVDNSNGLLHVVTDMIGRGLGGPAVQRNVYNLLRLFIEYGKSISYSSMLKITKKAAILQEQLESPSAFKELEFQSHPLARRGHGLR